MNKNLCSYGDTLAAILAIFRTEIQTTEAQHSAILILQTRTNLIENMCPQQRRLLIEIICEASCSTFHEVRLVALLLLKKLAKNYYHLLEEYMDSIIPVTLRAINSEDKDTHLQGFEFWKTISQTENPRDFEGRLVRPNNTNHKETKFFLKNSLEMIVRTLYYELVRGAFTQNPNSTKIYMERCKESTLEDDNYAKVKNKDDLLVDSQPRDCWSPPREVVIFFSELCESYPEAIDDHILPLVEVEIQNEDWRHRNAALWSILVFIKQMDSEHAKNVLCPLYSLVRRALLDQGHYKIRSVALWVISWMFEKYSSLLLEIQQDLQQLICDLINCLNNDEGRVPSSSCIALTSIVKAAYIEASLEIENGKRPVTFLLSPYFDIIAISLVKAANRRLNAAFDSILQVLLLAPEDCHWIVLDATDDLLSLLHKMIQLPEVHPVGCRCHEIVQKKLCRILRKILVALKPGKNSSKQLCDKFVKHLLCLLKQFPVGLAQLEARVALTTVSNILGLELQHYIHE